MTTHRQLVHGRVDRGDHHLLHREAGVRGISLTKCVRDIVREYFTLRQEMLSVIKAPDAPTTPTSASCTRSSPEWKTATPSCWPRATRSDEQVSSASKR